MPRLRIFAGPNGSGKSTLYRDLKDKVNLGVYLNADDLYLQINQTQTVDLKPYGLSHITTDILISFWKSHGLYERSPGLAKSVINKGVLTVKGVIKSYEAAVLTDFLRYQILETGQTLSFETVFSHVSKLKFIEEANKHNYRCYLYFSAVSSDQISVDRVLQRTLEGGHDVPIDKIKDRYTKSLENLLPAMTLVYRSYLFDNSRSMTLIAEVSPSKTLNLKTDQAPLWLDEHVLQKLRAPKSQGNTEQYSD